MPPSIYAKHLVQQGSEYTTKRDIHTYANLKSTTTKLSQDMIKYYTLHVYYITTKSKSKIYNINTKKAHELDEDPVSQNG